jgi:hypothetical protein
VSVNVNMSGDGIVLSSMLEKLHRVKCICKGGTRKKNPPAHDFNTMFKVFLRTVPMFPACHDDGVRDVCFGGTWSGVQWCLTSAPFLLLVVSSSASRPPSSCSSHVVTVEIDAFALLVDLRQQPVRQSAFLPHPPSSVFVLMVSKQTVLLLANFNRRATILRNQHLITFLDTHRHSLPIFSQGTRSHGQDFRLVEFLDGRFGEVDSTGRAGFGLDTLD